MSDSDDGTGSRSGGDGALTLQSLMASAEKLRDDASIENLEFIAYLADMTAMEIKREIERQDPSVEN